MQKTLKKLICFMLIISMALVQLVMVKAEDVEKIEVVGKYNYDYVNEVLKLVNEERAAEGAEPLEFDKDLLDAALLRAAENAILSDHKRPNGKDFYTATTASGIKANAENIAAGYSSPKGVVTGWMESPGHRRNMMNTRYKSIGIGCFQSNGTYYWVQMFSASSSTDKTTYSGVSDKVAVEIEVSQSNLHNLKLSGLKTTNELKVGDSLSIKKATLENADPGWAANSEISLSSVNFKSSNQSVFTIDNDGKITATGVGNATLTASLGDTSLTYEINVTNPLVSISMSEKTSLVLNGSKKLSVTYHAYAEGKETSDDKTVTWSSNNSDIVSVNSDGLITAHQLGEATITAKVGTLTTSTIVNVVDYLQGDLNRNGEIDIRDVLIALSILNGEKVPTSEDILIGDFDDNEIGLTDALKILNLYLNQTEL